MSCNTRLPRAAVILSLLAILGSVVTAQPRQTFRTATRLIEVSVVVTDRNGLPVPGLTQADFSVSDQREPQRISFFEVRDERTAPAPGAASAFRTRAGANAFTNAVAEDSGSTTVLVIDRSNTGWAEQRWAKQHIDRYLQAMRPGDRTALYAFDDAIRVLHDFTTDAASLRRALDLFQARTTGHYDASQEPPADTSGMAVWLVDPGDATARYFGERRAADTFKRLEIVAKHLAGIKGRKNLVWVSEAFAIPIGLGRMEVLEKMRRATQALSDAQTSVYPVDARGLIGSHSMNNRTGKVQFNTMERIHSNIDTMRVVADDTGGRAYFNTNAIDRSITRAVDDARLTYVLGYYPSSPVLDGRFRRIDVKVRKGGLQVRHRAGYLASAEPPRDRAGREEAIRAALEAPLQATEVSLAAEVNSATTTGAVDLAIRIDPGSLSLERDGSRWRGSADLLIAQVERSGKGKIIDATPLAFSLSDEERSRALATGLKIERRITLDPVVHELRIVVRDVASGDVGSLVIPKRALDTR